MLKLAIIVLSIGSVGLLSYYFFPFFAGKVFQVQEKRTNLVTPRLEAIFIRFKPHKLVVIYLFLPVFLGWLGFMFVNNLAGALIGMATGLVLPNAIIKNLERARQIKFNTQLADGLILLSNSLKAGLSLIQAIENLVKELPPPISQEFGIVLAENKIGVALEDSLYKLTKRLPSAELDLLVTSILLARETGGDLPKVFNSLVETIREKFKISENIKSLTLQGRIQGVVMSILPIAFCIGVFSFQPHFFDIMLKTEVGRGLLMYALFSEIMGVYMIYRVSHLSI